MSSPLLLREPTGPAPPHVPPGGTDLDSYEHIHTIVPGHGWAAVLIAAKCPECGRNPAPAVGWAEPGGGGGPTQYRRAHPPCAECRVLPLIQGCNRCPPAIVQGHLPPWDQAFDLGDLYFAPVVERHPRIGWSGLWPLVGRHRAGDFGGNGKLKDLARALTDRDRRAGPLCPPGLANALAIEAGAGLVRSSYALDPGGLGSGRNPANDNFYVHITTLLSDRGHVTVAGDRPA
jgi:hypothetical protein